MAQKRAGRDRELHAIAAMRYYEQHKEACKARMKAYRATPEYKAKRKEYVSKNKDKISRQEQITKKRHQTKHVSAVTDEYVASKLAEQGGGEKLEILQNQDLLGLKRIKILTKRLKREIKHHEKGH